MNRLPISALLAVAACSSDRPVQVRAQVIGSLEETIGGPHAIGTIGDLLLENDKVRLIIAKPGPGRVNTSYGGSLVDADLVRVGGGNAHGNDELAELLPGFAFTVINPTKVEVTHDGSADDCEGQRCAEVTVTGGGGDLLQMVYLLNTGLVYPETLQFKNAYRLYPGAQYVEIITTVTNTGNGTHPFPYADPSQLKALGFDVPGIENIQLSVPMGQLPLLGGEQNLFSPGRAGFNVQYAIEDTYPLAKGFPAFPGMVTDFLASKGKGVSYGLTMPLQPDKNYVNAFASGYSNQTVTPYSMLMPFTYAGVSAVYMANPPPMLAAGEVFSFTSDFVIGKGDVASVVDVIYELRKQVTGTFGGQVLDSRTSAPVTNASVVVLDAQQQPIDQMETDSTGQFLGHLPPGSYSYRVLADDRLTTAPQPFTVTAGQPTGVFVAFDPPASLSISVLDEQSRHAPVKIQLIGTYAAPGGVPTLPCEALQCPDPRDFLYSLALGERKRPTAFDGSMRFIENAWWTKDGKLSANVRPGKYDLVVSRGPEYEVTTIPVELRPGELFAQDLRVARAYDSDGWVAGDFHIHAQPSTDSGLPIVDRVNSCAAEGLEVAIATDHNYITDYAPVIAASGLDPWLLGVPGMELTTFEMGHFNAYPLKVDAGSTRGGEFDWTGKPPGDVFGQLRALSTDGRGIVQVNHPRQAVLGYFAQFFIDAATAEPYTPTGILGIFAPYGPEFRPENYSQDYDALELLTGRRFEDIHTFVAPTPCPTCGPGNAAGQIVVGKDGRPSFPGTVETWMTMLDRGHVVTGMGTSDSHHLLGDEPGYARTLLYVGHGRDVPGGFSRDDVVDAIRNHRAIVTNAPFIDLHINTGMIGDTVQASGPVDVSIHVKAPSWAKVNRLVVYTSSTGPATYDQPIPANMGTDYTTIVHLTVTKDEWVVAEVHGDDNMFPVSAPTEFPPLDATVIIKALSSGLDLSSLPITSSLKPERTHYSRPYAITNPIWIDTDGNGFTPPKPALLRSTITRSPPLPDVRAQFDSLPEITP